MTSLHGTKSTTVTLLLLLLTLLQVCHGLNLCSSIYDDATTSAIADATVEAATFHKSTPAGGVKAGTYTKDSKSSTLADCLAACCSARSCDTVFFHDGTCFLIECSSKELCAPQLRDDKKFEDTVMITVRGVESVVEESKEEKEEHQTTKGGSSSLLPSDVDVSALLDQLEVTRECEPDTDAGCRAGETCELLLQADVIGYLCQCAREEDKDPDTGKCIGTSSSSTSSSSVRHRNMDLSCLVGVSLTCEDTEECVPLNSRSRAGKCLCIDGYERDEETGWCLSTEVVVGENGKDEEIIQVKKATEAATADETSDTTTTTAASEEQTNKTTDKSTTPSSTKQGDTTKAQLQSLVVSAGDNQEIQLPENKVTLYVSTVPADTTNEYTYLWSLTDHPEGDNVGQMLDINSNSLKLSELIAGLYTFKVSVSATGKYGEAFVNVSVLPPARENVPPVAVIKPPSQSVRQPNDVVLDGSESRDDAKIVRYHWEQVSGPMSAKQLAEDEVSKQMLVIKNLGPGDYVFKLTVTDSDNAENSTFANVTVIKETDYPPKANAGSMVILSLPENSVKLYGNGSTDDKGIVSYEWIKTSDNKLTADMQGTRTSVLQLSNLEEGDYTFTLKVTDTSGQTDTADVHVFIKPEHNKPPVANAGIDKVAVLPFESVSLDGSNSTDDQKIDSYHWQQVSGPSSVELENIDRAVATVTKLLVGVYEFKLTVKDNEGLESTSVTKLTVRQNENKPPVAHAGGDKMVELTSPFISLDGSTSSDDKAIVSYTWTRHDNSLAAGDVLNGSDHQAVLQLANVVAGRYVFTLTVSDAEGLTNSDTASVIVKPDPHENDIVQLVIGSDITSFSEGNRDNLQKQLELLLHNKDGGETNVHIRSLHYLHPHQLSMMFYVTTDTKDSHVFRSGPEVAAILKKKLKSEDVIDYSVVTVDTVICQYNCSGHGRCDQGSKRCICEAFWMENIFDYYILDRDTNCDWSILYVIIVAFLLVVLLAGLTWGVICLCRSPSCCRQRSVVGKKRHRYTLLDEFNDGDKIDMLPKGKMPQTSSSLMISESDFSSDEETLFINHRKTNGHVKNGVKPPKGKVKT